jgi:hypothetical protein
VNCNFAIKVREARVIETLLCKNLTKTTDKVMEYYEDDNMEDDFFPTLTCRMVSIASTTEVGSLFERLIIKELRTIKSIWDFLGLESKQFDLQFNIRDCHLTVLEKARFNNHNSIHYTED